MACDNCSNGCSSCGNLEVGTGPAGLDGQNAYTVTTGNFTQPSSVGVPVVVSVDAGGQLTGLWAKVGQTIFIEGGGYYEVISSTTTTITVEIPDAATLAYNQAITPSGSDVTFPAGVSPAGVIGPQGATGQAGSSGTNGALILFKRLSGTPNTSTSYANLLAGTNGVTANRWQNVGDTVRVSFMGIGVATSGSTAPIIGGAAGDRTEYDYRITVGGVTCAQILGGSMITPLSSIVAQNGLMATIDLVAINMSPFTLAVHFKEVKVGPGVTSGAAYLVGSIPSFPLSASFQTGDPSATVTGIDPTVLNAVEIQGKHTVIGTSGSSTGQQVVPYAMAELFKIQ
jgi:hypothetical protein